MVRLKDLMRAAGSRLRKFGQTVVNGVRTGAQRVGNGLRNAYEFTRTRIVPTVVNAYHRGRRFLGNLNRVVEASSDAVGQVADIIGGNTGNRIQQGRERFNQRYQQTRDRVSEIHNRGENIYNRGRQIVDIGRNTYNQARQQMRS